MQTKLSRLAFCCALVCIFVSAGCAGVVSPTPGPLPPASPLATAAASPTVTPTLLPLSTPTVAATRTPTGVPTPGRTSSPVVSNLTGWLGKQGSPDNARANLTSRLGAPLGLVWEWKEENSRPVAIASTTDQVFLLTVGGQFCILNATTGIKKSCAPVWQETRGSTSGQIALTGNTALVSALELYIKPGDRYGTARTRLSAFSFDGQTRWASPVIDNQSGEAIVAGDGVVVFVSRSGIDAYRLTALDIATGVQRWQIPGYFEHGATDGKILYTDGKNVTALRLSTGEQVWTQAIDAKYVLYSQGRVIAAGDNTTTALDAANGKLLWKKDLGVFPLTYEEVGIAAAHGRVYLKPVPGQTQQGYRTGVIAFDAGTGKELWSGGTGPDRWVNQIAATVDSLVVTGQEWDGNTFAERLWILDAANGAELDRLVVSADPMEEMNELAVAGDRVYIVGRTLRVYGSAHIK